MELNEVINKRKSIRKYIDKDVPNELIEKLINAARLAPSAKNRQPWKYVIVKNETKNKIADIMIKQLQESKISLERKIYNTNSSVKATALIIKQAPVLILVFRYKDNNWIVGDALSIGASIEHICLKATDLGLGSLWIRDIVYTQNEIAHLVGKDNMELVCAVSIGYADDNSKVKIKKDLKEIMEWY